jgi:hypothetical protein
MPLSIMLLKTGVVPAPGPTLVYAPSNTAPKKVAIVKSMRFTNTGGSISKLRAWFQKGGGDFNGANARRILPYDQPIPPGYALIEDAEITLDSGDGIYLQLAAGGTVEFVFSGAERAPS